MENVRRIPTYLLCVVLYLNCLLGKEYEYTLDIPKDASVTRISVTVPVTSLITLVCQDSFRTNRVTWYKAYRKSYAANMSYNGTCNLNNDNYPSITMGYHACKGGNFSITFSRIRVADQGTWYCNTGGSSSNLVEISVVEIPTSTSLSTTSTHIESTLPTTSTHTVSTLITTSANIESTLTTTSIDLISTPITSLPTTSSETQGFSTRKQEAHVGVTEETMKTKVYIPLIAGLIGGIVGLVIIITIVSVLVMKRRHFENDLENTVYGDSVEMNELDDADGAMGGDYAQISGVNKTKESNSACRNDSDDDEFVMAENPLYVTYNKDEYYEMRSDEVTPPYEVTDVYSVVQKPVKK